MSSARRSGRVKGPRAVYTEDPFQAAGISDDEVSGKASVSSKSKDAQQKDNDEASDAEFVAGSEPDDAEQSDDANASEEAAEAEIENENEDILTKSVNKLGIFQSQLDLFECIGRILTLLNNNGNENNSNKIENQLNCLNMIIQPILKDTYDNINKSSDIESILKVHHNILAIGSLSKGLSESTSSNSNEIPQFTPLLRNIVECLFLTI